MQHYNNKKIDAGLLGKIVLARFLELPLRTFDRLVTQVESSAGFAALRPWVTVGQLEDAQVAHDAGDTPQTQASPVLGEIMKNLYHGTGASRGLMFLYHRDCYAREYRFDHEGVDHLMSRPDFPAELVGVLRRLRLINTRNRLTHALMQAVLASQAAYLRSGQALALLASLPPLQVPIDRSHAAGAQALAYSAQGWLAAFDLDRVGDGMHLVGGNVGFTSHDSLHLIRYDMQYLNGLLTEMLPSFAFSNPSKSWSLVLGIQY